MATKDNNLIPAIATHPGSVLQCELRERGIKQKDFAKTLGMPAPNLSELIKGKRHMTEAIAMKLEEALGISFQTWMNLQNRYHYVIKSREEMDGQEATAISEEQSLRTRINLPFVYKLLGIIALTATKRLEQLKSHIAINLNELQALEVNTVGFFKRSDTLKIDEINMRTWLLLAWSEATKAQIPLPYAPGNGIIAATEIARLANACTLTTDKIREILNRQGIIYLNVQKLDSAPIDAYSLMAGSHPVIVVTYRHNDMDKLVFDVLHEIGHIEKHLPSGKSYISVEGEYSSLQPEEREANEFARDLLIAPAVWNNILKSGVKNLSPYVVAHTIAREAKKYGISPSIAVSRYKHDSRCYVIRNYRSPKIS
ncbi:MAG: HigA family addiction module antidote protein [Odoribacter sp.]|nr:HigA family addiction module antidote protein [Odoribacter sp.]